MDRSFLIKETFTRIVPQCKVVFEKITDTVITVHLYTTMFEPGVTAKEFSELSKEFNDDNMVIIPKDHHHIILMIENNNPKYQ